MTEYTNKHQLSLMFESVDIGVSMSAHPYICLTCVCMHTDLEHIVICIYSIHCAPFHMFDMCMYAYM